MLVIPISYWSRTQFFGMCVSRFNFFLLITKQTSKRHLEIHWAACTTLLSNIKKTMISWINAFNLWTSITTNLMECYESPPRQTSGLPQCRLLTLSPCLTSPHFLRLPLSISLLIRLFANWRTFVISVFALSESFAATLYFTHTKEKKQKKMCWGDVTTQQELWGNRFPPWPYMAGGSGHDDITSSGSHWPARWIYLKSPLFVSS